MSLLPLPNNEKFAFIQRQPPSTLQENVWTEAGEQMIALGVRRKTKEAEDICRAYATISQYSEAPLLGSRARGMLRVILPDGKDKLYNFLGALCDKQLISEDELDQIKRHWHFNPHLNRQAPLVHQNHHYAADI